MKKAKRGGDALNELHRKISPTILEEEECSEALADDSPTKAPPLKTMLPQGKEKLRRLALSITASSFSAPCRKPYMLHPLRPARWHDYWAHSPPCHDLQRIQYALYAQKIRC
jgi:hypothetical protein